MAETKQKEKEEQKEGETVRIYIMGREYKVPAGLTIMKAMEYAGYRFIRGCGCRGGFCGACATVYRKKGDYKLRMDLACQKVVEDGMYLVQLPFTPAEKAIYNLSELQPTTNVLLEYYPEIAKCVSCNTCTKACPQDLEVMDFVQAAIRETILRLHHVRLMRHEMPSGNSAIQRSLTSQKTIRKKHVAEGETRGRKNKGD